MDKPVFSMILPLPPSVNHYWGYAVKRVKGRPIVHCYLTSKAQAYRDEVRLILHLCRNPATPPLKGRLKAVITLHQKTRHKTDVDNFNKGLLDALTHAGVYQDDSQIDELVIKRGEIIKGGQVDVELYKIKD